MWRDELKMRNQAYLWRQYRRDEELVKALEDKDKKIK